MLLERFDPGIHGFELLRVEPIKPLLPLFFDRHDADLSQHTKVLRNRRLRQSQRQHKSADCQRAALRKLFNDLPPPRFGDGVEDVGCCRGSWHGSNIFPYRNMSSLFFVAIAARAETGPPINWTNETRRFRQPPEKVARFLSSPPTRWHSVPRCLYPKPLGNRGFVAAVLPVTCSLQPVCWSVGPCAIDVCWS